MSINAQELSVMILDFLRLCPQVTSHPGMGSKKAKGNIPYTTHLSASAWAVLLEEKLTEEMREKIVRALLAHNFIGIKNLQLPKWCCGVEALAQELVIGRDKNFSFRYWEHSSPASVAAIFDTEVDLRCEGVPDNGVLRDHIWRHSRWVADKYPGLIVTKTVDDILLRKS